MYSSEWFILNYRAKVYVWFRTLYNNYIYLADAFDQSDINKLKSNVLFCADTYFGDFP